MAFEGYSLYPPLTVKENMAFALKASKLSSADVEKKVAEIAALLEIESILEKYPSSISGGQQQRASLGRALIRDADLHLLDEPMGQLEPQLRAVLRGRIKHFIKERGLTAILVTHDQTEANALSDRIAVMEGGVLQQFDKPSHHQGAPANLFTGTFVGEPPMNVFNVKVEAAGDKLSLVMKQRHKAGLMTGRRSLPKSATLWSRAAASPWASGPMPCAAQNRTKAESSPTSGSATRRISPQALVMNRWCLSSTTAPACRAARRSRLSLRLTRCISSTPASGAAISHGRELAG